VVEAEVLAVENNKETPVAKMLATMMCLADKSDTAGG
jgi:hypothetical protein